MYNIAWNAEIGHRYHAIFLVSTGHITSFSHKGEQQYVALEQTNKETNERTNACLYIYGEKKILPTENSQKGGKTRGKGAESQNIYQNR